MLYGFGGKRPALGRGVFVAGSAEVIGEVALGDFCNVWCGAVIRGDVNWIRIGERTNVQDGAVVHVTHGTHPTRIGAGVVIGHHAILHGCTVGDRVLIGIGARVLDGATVGEGSLVAAGAVVRPGTVVPPRSLVAGVPGAVKRAVTDAEYAEILENAARHLEYVRRYAGSDLPHLLTPE